MKIDYRRPDLSIDQQLALRTAATNLAQPQRRRRHRARHRADRVHHRRRVTANYMSHRCARQTTAQFREAAP